jgi:GDP-L-fucose synthase
VKLQNKNVLVTGGNGMIGRALVELLYDTTSANIMVADLPNVDLRDRKDCKAVCEGQDIVFHLAGIKGSPIRCMNSPASFSVPQIQFNANMIEAAYNAGVEWFLYTSSVGVYHPTEIFVEDDVWKTFPSENDWYPGWAKRVGEMNVQAYMKEYNWNKCSIVRPANVYGPNDNFGDESTVIASLIKKANENEVLEVWGDGSPIRDFIYSEDVARGMLHMVENEVTEPVNLASGTGVTIKDLAFMICEYFNVGLSFDESKPNGDMKRILSTERAESYGFKPQVSLDEGIHRTINWYKEFMNEL